MRDKDEINERRRRRIRGKKVEGLQRETEDEAPVSELAETIDRRLKAHEEEFDAMWDAEKERIRERDPQRQLRWRDRFLLLLLRWSFWWRSKLDNFKDSRKVRRDGESR